MESRRHTRGDTQYKSIHLGWRMLILGLHFSEITWLTILIERMSGKHWTYLIQSRHGLDALVHCNIHLLLKALSGFIHYCKTNTEWCSTQETQMEQFLLMDQESGSQVSAGRSLRMANTDPGTQMVRCLGTFRITMDLISWQSTELVTWLLNGRDKTRQRWSWLGFTKSLSSLEWWNIIYS